MVKKGILLALIGVLIVAGSIPTTIIQAQQAKKKIYISGITVDGAPASMAREIRNIIEVALYEYGNEYRVITDDDIKVMYKKAEQLMAGGCTAESCQQQIADAIDADEILYGELVVKGDTGIFKGKNLLRDRKSLQIDVKSVVQYQFAMAQKEYYLKEIAKKLIDSRHVIVAKKGEEPITPLAFTAVNVKEIAAIQFVTSDEGVNRITALLKEEIEEGDELYNKNRYDKALKIYEAILEKIANKLTADKQEKVKDIQNQVAQRRDASYSKLYAQRVYEVDEALNKAATVEALQQLAGRYSALAYEVEHIEDSRWGEGKLATLEGIQYRCMKVYEKASEQQFRGYNFTGAQESMLKAYSVALKVADMKKRYEYSNDYAVKVMAIITTGQGYTGSRVQAYLDIAQYYNYKDDTRNAKKNIQQAYDILLANKQYMTRETVRQYNDTAQLIGGTIIKEDDYFYGFVGVAVVTRHLKGDNTKVVIKARSDGITAKDMIGTGDAIVSVNGIAVKDAGDIEHELDRYVCGAAIVLQVESITSNVKPYCVVEKKDSSNIKNFAIEMEGEDNLVKAVLDAHNDTVDSVAWSPDGRYIVSGSDDKTIRVWDATTYRLKATLTGHNGWVLSVVWSPDGRSIVSGSADNTIMVWDAQTCSLKATLTGHNDLVLSVVWSPDGRYIVSGSSDKTIRVWDAQTCSLKATLMGHNDWVHSVVWSPDGRYIVSGSRDKTIRVWDAQTYSLKATLMGYNDWVYSVVWSPDGRYIVSGSRDGTIMVSDLKINQGAVFTGHNDAVELFHSYRKNVPSFLFTGHNDAVESVAWSPDGRSIVSGSADATVRVWDAKKIPVTL